MNVIAKDYVFIGMDKTGSSSLRKLVREIEQVHGWVRFPEESSYTLPSELANYLVIGSIRNPFTWYASYWTWYGEERFRGHWKSDGINSSSSFEEWVRNYPDYMVEEMERLYLPTARLIRMEYQSQDLTRILEEIRGPLPEQTLELIENAELVNKNPNPKPDCSETIREIILKGARPIFEKYYPEELV